MDILTILRIIVTIWPLIEQIIQQIEDMDKKKEAEEKVAQVFSDMLRQAA